MSTIYYRKEVSLDVAGDANYTEKAFERDNLTRSEQYLLGCVVVRKTLANAGTHNFDNTVVTSPKVLYLEVSGTCTVMFNAGNQALTLSPSSGQTSTLWVDGATWTSCVVTNTSGADITITGVLAG